MNHDERVRGFFRKRQRFFQCLWILICGLLFFSAGCATVYNPATGRQEHVFIDSAQEVLIGRSMADNIIKQEYKPVADAARQLSINKLGQRMAQVSDRREIVYHFMILDSPDFNAFALPGGYIFVYRGLAERMPEPELASVLAHEIGHVAARHSVKKMEAALGYNFLLVLALAGVGQENAPLIQNISGVTNTVYDLLSRGYSRNDELLADRLAVQYLRRAGYDPHAMAQALMILNKETGPGGRVFEVLSTHPRMEERIKKVEEEIQKDAGTADPLGEKRR